MSVRAQEVSSKWTIFGVQRQSSSGTSSILVSDASLGHKYILDEGWTDGQTGRQTTVR
jgi:hypothetical protein